MNSVKVMFIAYLVFLIFSVAYFSVIGITHH